MPSGLNRDDRIKQLQETIGPDGVKAAKQLHSIDLDIIRFAFFTHPQRQSESKGFGKRLETILARLPKDEAESIRASLIAAKSRI